MRILHLVDDYGNPGGEAVSVKCLAAAVKDAEHDFFSYQSMKSRPLYSFTRMCRMMRDCDIMHFHNVTNPLSWFIILMGAKKRKIVTMRVPEMRKAFPKNELNEIRRVIVSNMLSLLFDRVIFLNEWSRKKYSGRTLFRSKFMKKSNIIHNFVDGSFFETTTVKSRSKEKFGVLFVGALNRRKGIPSLLQVIERLSCRQDIAFTIAGSGELLGDVEKACEKCDNLQYAGVLGGKELVAEYDNADALILPALGEQCPLVIIEAMARKCIVLASNIPTLAEMMVNGKNGLLFSPYDEDDIFRKIIEASELNEGKKREMINYNMKLLEERFDQATQAGKYLDEYQSLVGAV